MTGAFDKEELLEELDGDREFLMESLEIMNEDAPELLQQIRDGISSGDAEAVATGAHTMKSMVGNFCAAPAHAAALHLETIGRGGDLSAAPAGLSTLEQEVTRLKQELESFAAELE